MHEMIVLLFLAYISVALSANLLSLTANETRNSEYFYYVSSGEGVISHLAQLYAVWLTATAINRSVYMCGFHSGHYEDVKYVYMCDLFILPANIDCVSAPSTTILTIYNCTYTTGQKQCEWKDGVKQVQFADINFKEVECFAGTAHTSDKLLSTYESTVKEKFLAPPFFMKKYLNLFPMVKSILGLTSGEYMTVHWRRGDYLSKRCGENDHSVNCGNETDFVKVVREEIKQLSSNHRMRVYVATNEADPDIIDYLHSNGFEMNGRLKKHFAKLNMELTSVDLFMVDLMLMCDAKYFMGWGSATSIDHYFVFKYCRNAEVYPDKITIHDGKITDTKYK
jgi:hypothetical protein